MHRRMNREYTRTTNLLKVSGTSLVELLVVIVIFLVGILAIAQIFPGGFRILNQTRAMAAGASLARDEMDRLKSRPDQLAEQIIPVIYTFSGSTLTIAADPSHNPSDLGPQGVGLADDGQLLDASNRALGPWQYLTGANRVRRVISESRVVPAPQNVGVSGLGEFGGLMSLQFAPIVYNSTFSNLVDVYGNNMEKRLSAPFGRGADYVYYIENADDNDPTLWVMRSPVRNRSYRLQMTVYYTSGGNTFSRDLTDQVIPVPSDPAGGYVAFSISSLASAGGGETFAGVDVDSIQVARRFERTDLTTPFSSGEPYEYKMLNPELGLLLFNPAGYQYMERRRGRTLPLVARVNYDVYDWRIIRQEFRVPNVSTPTMKLSIGTLAIKGRPGADGRTYDGMNVPVDPSVGTTNPDFILLDLDTGGLFLYDQNAAVDPTKSSFSVDKSVGLITFQDFDSNASNGVQGRLAIPTATGYIVQTVDMAGRAVRALYQGRDEWSVQVLKAAATYRGVYGLPSQGQFYVGGSNAAYGFSALSSAEGITRIYFPKMDVNQKVTIGELWYRTSGGQTRVIRSQDYVIEGRPVDTALGGLPYIDITTVDSDAVGFDFSRGYPVKYVLGASIIVRTMYNGGFFGLTTDPVTNMERLNQWGQGWKRQSTETFLQRSNL